MERDALDPRGLIREAYTMPHLTAAECRSIFLDWALDRGDDPRPDVRALLARHAAPDHPMTTVLRAGLSDPPATRRRGGRRARLS